MDKDKKIQELFNNVETISPAGWEHRIEKDLMRAIGQSKPSAKPQVWSLWPFWFASAATVIGVLYLSFGPEKSPSRSKTPHAIAAKSDSNEFRGKPMEDRVVKESEYEMGKDGEKNLVREITYDWNKDGSVCKQLVHDKERSLKTEFEYRKFKDDFLPVREYTLNFFGSAEKKYKYDKEGRLLEMTWIKTDKKMQTESEETWSYHYNDKGFEVRVDKTAAGTRKPYSQTLKEYDENGNLTRLEESEHGTVHKFSTERSSKDGRNTRVQEVSAEGSSIAGAMLEVEKTVHDNLTGNLLEKESFGYANKIDRVSEEIMKSDRDDLGPVIRFEKYAYEYDAKGRISKELVTRVHFGSFGGEVPGPPGNLHSSPIRIESKTDFIYDGMGRLTTKNTLVESQWPKDLVQWHGEPGKKNVVIEYEYK